MLVSIFLILGQWQQTVSYKIDVDLDIHNNAIDAVEHVTYHNRSPCDLETLYCHLYINAVESEQTVLNEELRLVGSDDFPDSGMLNRGYLDIGYIKQDNENIDFQITNSSLAIPLKKPLCCGDSVSIEIAYSRFIKDQGSQIMVSKNHYEIFHWYPKICL
jgi:hypothetical protein